MSLAEFVGHGAFGIMTKAAWVPYFGVVGIPPELAWKLMPVIGTMDVSIGLLVGMVRPARVLLLYMAVWGLLTATIRPLAGESIWEFVERIPNWAIPLAFLCLRGPGRSRYDWLSRMRDQLVAVARLEWLMRLAVAGAFVGHGAYSALLAKSSWFSYFAALGMPESLGGKIRWPVSRPISPMVPGEARWVWAHLHRRVRSGKFRVPYVSA